MKFGIFFELSVPRPWSREIEGQVYWNSLEQVRLADELGFDYVWAVEHHFLEEYSHCSAPEVFLAACAAQTSRIRVGHGIVVCVPQMNHPIRVAERAAVLDIISRGRLDVGTGRSSTWTELGGFNADPDGTKRYWDEYVSVLPKMWTQERFSYSGYSFEMPERAILPKPYQQPHPPMWVAVTSPGTEIDAATRGLGCLGLAALSYEDQEKRTAEYRRLIRNCDPVGEVVTEEICTLNFLFCHEDDQYALDTGRSFVAGFQSKNSQLLWAREAYPTPSYITRGNLVPSVGAGTPGDQHKEPAGVAIGDPARIIEQIRRWESVGITGINFLLNGLEIVPQDEVLASLRLFASEVMPKFREGDGSVQAAANVGGEDHG